MQDLRSLVEEQRAELEAQRAALKAEQLKMEALEEKLGATPSEPERPAARVRARRYFTAARPSRQLGSGPSAALATPRIAADVARRVEEKPSPLYFKIGGAEFYPLGFMDLTNVFRTTTTRDRHRDQLQIASRLPIRSPGAYRRSLFSAKLAHRSENTRQVWRGRRNRLPRGRLPGIQPANANDTSNSDTLRMRLYWVDVKSGMWEVLGGQSWSFLTPNRNGLSALPGDLFYSQDVDTNYQLGLTWARQAGIRFIAAPDQALGRSGFDRKSGADAPERCGIAARSQRQRRLAV